MHTETPTPRVLLMQLPVPNNSVTNVPLAAGYLKAYAHTQGLLDRVQVEILPRAVADSAGDALLVEEIARRAPDVLGISLYTWNSERSLAIAMRAKQRLPRLRVVVGGPEVQADNHWLTEHPAADVLVFGEGEQVFADLLRLLAAGQPLDAAHLRTVPGLGFRDLTGALLRTGERPALENLAVVPSPYLLGFLEIGPGGMLMTEVSRWCPYACSFCLYGRNMGTKLGNRYFPLEQVLAEIRWAKERGAASIHFIEANLNLVPLFAPLMAALSDLNADGQLALYAELRGEHLREETVAALATAGLRVAEVGLQTANPVALHAAHRRTDLHKWAAGTRRLYAHGVDVLLDVIVGLPEDDAAGIEQTLAFIASEQLGAYDAFTLQVLPGTAVRSDAERFGLAYQQRPPYYVQATEKLNYAELRRLRRDVKIGAGIDPDAVEGCPEPRRDALAGRAEVGGARTLVALDQPPCVNELAAHVDVVGTWADLRASAWLPEALAANPASLFDCYIHAEQPPAPAELAAWRAALPFTPGYLDRVAAYRQPQATAFDQVSPRLWLVVPWTAQLDPAAYAGCAEIIWCYPLAAHEPPPLGAWRAAGGGIWAQGASAAHAAHAEAESGLRVWHGPATPERP